MCSDSKYHAIIAPVVTQHRFRHQWCNLPDPFINKTTCRREVRVQRECSQAKGKNMLFLLRSFEVGEHHWSVVVLQHTWDRSSWLAPGCHGCLFLQSFSRSHYLLFLSLLAFAGGERKSTKRNASLHRKAFRSRRRPNCRFFLGQTRCSKNSLRPIRITWTCFSTWLGSPNICTTAFPRRV